MEMPQIHRPIPQRTFEVTPASTDSSRPPSPSPENMNPELLLDRRNGTSLSPSRTRSILNLTSSTLFGIYSGTGSEGRRDGMSTPWGTGAQTPSLRRSDDDASPPEPRLLWNEHAMRPQVRPRKKRSGFRGYYMPLALQTVLLFGFGVAYGSIVTQLQETQKITPLPVPGVERNSVSYHAVWGLSGVLLGNALPLVDTLWRDKLRNESTDQPLQSQRARSSSDQNRASIVDSDLGPIWYSAVRSIGAFVGIAFAVRRLPWQSTLQVSLTLALANPVLWYLIDRSMPGFAFSSAVGVLGTFILLLVNPTFVPLPAIHQAVASEQVGVYTWLASILFCTSLCFGAIGRKLQL